MKVSEYLKGYGGIIDSKSFDEIERDGGDLIMHEQQGEEGTNENELIWDVANNVEFLVYLLCGEVEGLST